MTLAQELKHHQLVLKHCEKVLADSFCLKTLGMKVKAMAEIGRLNREIYCKQEKIAA